MELDLFGIKLGTSDTEDSDKYKEKIEIYNIPITKIMEKLSIKGKLVYITSDYKKKILTLKVKKE